MMEYLNVGQRIKIERRNGRCHSAKILRKHESQKLVSVQWSEHGEMKGKDIRVDAIIRLNPEIMPVAAKRNNNQRSQPPPPRKNVPSTSGGGEPHRPLPSVNSDANIRKGLKRKPNEYIKPNAQWNANLPALLPRPKSTKNILATPRRSMCGAGGGGNATAAPAPGTGVKRTASKVLMHDSRNSHRSYVFSEGVQSARGNNSRTRVREEKNFSLTARNPHWETAAMIRSYQQSLEFKPTLEDNERQDHQITVCVRKRPLSRKEIDRQELDIISIPMRNTLVVHEPRAKVNLTKFLENHKFRFDYIFDERCSNQTIYKYTAKPLVQTVMDGGMATCFAYGQTGAGKTHTMGGEYNGKTHCFKSGIYSLATADVFAMRSHARYQPLRLVVYVSFFEIYGGKVFDLLANKRKLRILEDGHSMVQVVGLTERAVSNVDDVLKYIERGTDLRTSGKTPMSSNSSRSHGIFQIVLRKTGSTKVYGKFSFVDLAGNERAADTASANRQTRIEGAEINKSLLALKECIRALGKNSAHLPFRVSKLTHVLRDSFIGEKSRTCMIAMVSPGLSSCEYTLNTLRYADRVKELVVKELYENVSNKKPVGDISPKSAGGESIAVTECNFEGLQDDAVDVGVDTPRQTYVNGDNEHDLNFLQAFSESNEMSDDALIQHAAISDLQHIEDRVVEQHRHINEFLTDFITRSRKLYKVTNVVDYDQDLYCTEGEEMFKELVELANSCRDLMAEFRSKLTKEEMVSWSKTTTNAIIPKSVNQTPKVNGLMITPPRSPRARSASPSPSPEMTPSAETPETRTLYTMKTPPRLFNPPTTMPTALISSPTTPPRSLSRNSTPSTTSSDRTPSQTELSPLPPLSLSPTTTPVVSSPSTPPALSPYPATSSSGSTTPPLSPSPKGTPPLTPPAPASTPATTPSPDTTPPSTPSSDD